MNAPLTYGWLRCYCCGDPVGTEVALVTMVNEPVDRVFIMLPAHVERVQMGVYEIASRIYEPRTIG